MLYWCPQWDSGTEKGYQEKKPIKSELSVEFSK